MLTHNYPNNFGQFWKIKLLLQHSSYLQNCSPNVLLGHPVVKLVLRKILVNELNPIVGRLAPGLDFN